jgi:putative glutamine amidotransferase
MARTWDDGSLGRKRWRAADMWRHSEGARRRFMAKTESNGAPLIGVTACSKTIGPHPFHAAGDKYVRAVSHGAGGLPLVIPALSDFFDPADLADRMDGLMLTGSPSNVEPHHYGGAPAAPGTEHDAPRDAMALPLARAALEAGVPILAICLGIQELNVVMGGTLHQRVHELPGKLDHRGRKHTRIDVRYGAAHAVSLTHGGYFASLAGSLSMEVNSLHAQSIDRVADGLIVEAVAPDGIVEAVRAKDSRAFTVGVQWHPEWKFWDNSISKALFKDFGAACRARAAARATRRKAVA